MFFKLIFFLFNFSFINYENYYDLNMIVKEQKNGDSGVDSSGAEGQLLPYEIQKVYT